MPSAIPAPQGLLYIISAPSGAGKSSLNKALLAHDPTLHMSVSYTTRAPRLGEVDGRDYNFIDIPTFEAKKAAGEFLETAFVHGNYYGTNRIWIEEQLQAGNNILLEIDWQGADQVRKIFPDAVSIFILPPSFEVLASRLKGRATDSADVIAARLAGAQREINEAPNFQFVIVNDIFETACDELFHIVAATKLTFGAQKRRHPAFFAKMGL